MWTDYILIVTLIPVILIVAYMIGRMFGLGVGKSISDSAIKYKEDAGLEVKSNNQKEKV